MNWIINLLAKLFGVSGWFGGENAQILAGLGAALSGAAHIAVALSGANDTASALAVLKSSQTDYAAVAAGVGLIISHFKHQDVVAQANAMPLPNATTSTAAPVQPPKS